jgi:hypothetical protein
MFLARMPAYTKASPQVVWQTKRKISPWSMVLYLDEEEDEDMVYSEILEILDGLRRDEADQLVLKKRQTFSKSTLRLPPDLSHFKSCCAKISDFNYQKSHKTTFEKLTHSHRAQCAR